MIAATTTLEVRVLGRWRPMEVRIHVPVQDQDWVCAYEIDWPEGRRSFRAHGIDSAQAMLLAFFTIGVELHASDYFKDKRLRSDEKSGELNIPLISFSKPLDT